MRLRIVVDSMCTTARPSEADGGPTWPYAGMTGYYFGTYKHTLTLTAEMEKRLDAERERRCLQTVPETIRAILSEYGSTHKIDVVNERT